MLALTDYLREHGWSADIRGIDDVVERSSKTNLQSARGPIADYNR